MKELTLLSRLPEPGTELAVRGLRGAATAAVAAAAAAQASLCCIVPDEHMVATLVSDLTLFTEIPVVAFPGHETPPYTPLAPEQTATAARLAALYRMRSENRLIVVASIATLQRRILSPAILADSAEYLEADENFDRDQLLDRLIRMGYSRTALVQSAGDFAVRGGIIDLYPPPFLSGDGTDCAAPLRLDFFGDTIESIRTFDPVSQRSTGELQDATLLPVSEILLDHSNHRRISRLYAEKSEELDWDSDQTRRLIEYSNAGERFPGIEFFLPLYAETATFFAALAADSIFILVDPAAINEALELNEERILANHKSALAARIPALPPNELFLTPQQFGSALDHFSRLALTDFPHADSETITVKTTGHLLLKQEVERARTRLGLLTPLSDRIHQWRQRREKTVLCCRSQNHAEKLGEILESHHHTLVRLTPPLSPAALANSDPEHLCLCSHPLTEGFSLPAAGLHFVSESELFGNMRIGSGTQKAGRGEPVRFTELNDGDIVVHREHGLGLYRGIATITTGGITADFMLLEYRDGDRLYLPVDRLNLISRYQGLSDHEPRLDKLGSRAWATTTGRVKEEVWKVAEELLSIYAERELKQGRRFTAPGAMYRELEESFPYDETPGQAAAISDVLDDLTREKPMDRLICGDVGYGKTEVAIRAAFKVVEDGCQVAVLVPTTVLAEQHNRTFSERLRDFPVTLACLNRFRSSSEQRTILNELREGRIDIIIGTHRLLSRDVDFRDLGLLIIDEEHRFGVAHKERLKKMRTEVDILTLTATPIPRTLQMSLLAIRDLSVISTPPAHRRPVKTFIASFDELVVREAVSRELRRGGRVYFVHNRVKSIHRTASLIEKLVPEAKIAVAHGQMEGSELEKIMISFVSGNINVLVATTIIESGLDIPEANTIIINRADMLGLAEIYQLRGRVGRASQQSYAYLLVSSLDHLTREARERLRALIDTSELGGGFKLAMSDLQIRGGGNLLGVSQSGNIAAIGYDLYLDLLEQTITDLKAARAEGKTTQEKIDPEVKLQLAAHIPGSYIPDISQRYITYRRIAALAGAEQSQRHQFEEELRDRYGRIPEATLTLLRIIDLKRELADLRIEKLEQGPDNFAFTFKNDTPLTPEMLLAFLSAHPQTKRHRAAKFTPDGRLVHFCLNPGESGAVPSEEEVFTALTAILGEFHRLLQREQN